MQYRYQTGTLASATMKADYRRLRAAHPERYAGREVVEPAGGPSGTPATRTVRVVDAVPLRPQARHDLHTRGNR